MEGKLFSELSLMKNNHTSFSSGIDFTLVDPRATTRDVEKSIDVAYTNRYYGVVFNPSFTMHARKLIDAKYSSALKLTSLIGYPLGCSHTKTKIQETIQAVKDGADEIEVVVNIGKVKEGDFNYIKQEFLKIRRKAKKKLLKGVLETAYLTEQEIQKLVNALARAKVDMIVTSTGYAPLGADIEIVENLVKVAKREKMLVKAAGGISSKSQAENFMRLGTMRIGTSRVL